MLKALAALAVLFSGTASSEVYEGPAIVLDGDTVAIDGAPARIRLDGIDAPEGRQSCEDESGRLYACGSRATQELRQLVDRFGTLKCLALDRDRFGRIVAECELPNGVSVNAAMVWWGWAVEYEKYSDGRFAVDQDQAREAGRGLWAGQFVQPWEWRRGKRLGSERVAQGEPEECQIKGNINARGARIYHSPEQQHYAETVIDTNADERWFCSSDEAESAGWRAALR